MHAISAVSGFVYSGQSPIESSNKPESRNPHRNNQPASVFTNTVWHAAFSKHCSVSGKPGETCRLLLSQKLPGGLVHFDTKRLPRLKSEIRHSAAIPPMAIDDLSRALYDAIRPDKTPDPAASFLNQVITEYLYTMASYLFRQEHGIQIQKHASACTFYSCTTYQIYSGAAALNPWQDSYQQQAPVLPERLPG